MYYELICKIYKDNNKKTLMCLLGDKYQCIYDFKNTYAIFILFTYKLFNFNNLSWNICNLSQSYRITKEMADFINSDRIKSKKVSYNKPTYIICDTFIYGKESCPFIEVRKYLNL